MIKLISKISLFLVILLQSSLAFAQTKPVLNSSNPSNLSNPDKLSLYLHHEIWCGNFSWF